MSREPLTAPCSTEFKAAHSSGTRDRSEVRWVVLHDEEAGTARSAAEYFTHFSSGGSAHLCVDDNECYACLGPNQIPWGAASAPSIQANRRGYHIEQAGYASWSPTTWLSHVWLLRRAAYKAAVWAKYFDVPVRFVAADDLKVGRSGITTHAEISKASRELDPDHAHRYTHSDPGTGWPRAAFMSLCRYYTRRLKDGTL